MTNSNTSHIINHDGIVQRKGDNNVIVAISVTSACAGCHSEASCNLSGKEEKIIEVHGRYNVEPGDAVTVLMKQSMGYAAVFLGYILPLIVVIVSLITLVAMKIPEFTAGIISIAILLPYYIVLFFFRKKINKQFTFTLKV